MKIYLLVGMQYVFYRDFRNGFYAEGGLKKNILHVDFFYYYELG